MAQQITSSPEGENRLLSLLPALEYERLRHHLKGVSLEMEQVLYQPHQPVGYLYFPVQGSLSAPVVMEDGDAIEVATIGSEGAAGISVLFGGKTSLYRVIVQMEGRALRVPADVLLREAERQGPLRDVLPNYIAAFLTQVSQSVACHGLHSIRKRCCKWLLMMRDRIPGDELQITHEFLSLMLGVRRTSVTEVLQSLQQQGLIHCKRGKIQILDREGMGDESCECYRTIRQTYERLLRS